MTKPKAAKIDWTTLDSSIRPTLTVEDVAEGLGISRQLVYNMIKSGKFPINVIRIGPKVIRIPTASFLDLLGVQWRGK